MSTPPIVSLHTLADAARQAGLAIMRVYATAFAVQHKPDRSPVTEADLAAHAAIATVLHRAYPHIPLVSEEQAHASLEERLGWPTYFLVDPLDGTKEFVQRTGQFAVNIALVHQGRAVAGVVYAPVRDQLWAGALGQGAWVVTKGVRQPIHTRKAQGQRPHLLTNFRTWGAHKNELMERFPQATVAFMGSSIKMALVAAGEADLNAVFAPTSQWDTAAPTAIVEAAGGAVLSWPELAPATYWPQPSFTNPMLLAVGDLRWVMA